MIVIVKWEASRVVNPIYNGGVTTSPTRRMDLRRLMRFYHEEYQVRWFQGVFVPKESRRMGFSMLMLLMLLMLEV